MREEEKLGREVMIRSDPNYVGEIERHIGRGRARASPTDTNVLLCDQIAGRYSSKSGHGHHRNSLKI